MKVAYLLGLTLAAASFSAEVLAADWADNSVGISYGSRYREPGVNEDIAKTVFNFTHASGYKYGSNFFSADFLKSDSKDPSAGTGNTDGALEVYAVYRNQLSMSAVSGKKLAFGPVRDVSLSAGFDVGTKNTTFASRPIKLVIGPTLNFAIDKGFFDFSVFYYHETNNNGIVGKKVTFDSTYQLSAAWSKGFELGLPLVFKGYAVHTGAKGLNGFGMGTGPETVVHTVLMADIGSLAGKPGTVYAGVGIDHFTNKFGERGVNQTTPIAALEVHF
ncbi:hypothetical protein [Herbaspirillum autotrophicum]|uniref:hypothetical protein n=1 Tax=Herbaspirillum autotrophicum TaxID=180195 RepID=UPI000A70830F|nr:hypothetical protein [Herbaspirillum autotrophicum]